MARVRLLEISGFRGVRSLRWEPSPGLNCLIGSGDAGKTTILDAIDLCVGARRNTQFSDADFHRVDTATPIEITVTMGDLPDALRSMEAYGPFLRGWDAAFGTLEDEPGADLETVLTVMLAVAADLEPAWSLVSDRASSQGLTRSLAWADRVRLAPMRIGGSANANLGWRRGSVLDRLSEERADATAALVKAAREAREAFGAGAQEQLGETLATVDRVAAPLGVPMNGGARASLDASSMSFSGGTVSLHDARGVPLSALGTGSARLLVAGLQREAAPQAGIVLADEVEYGLEPHRIIGLLGSLGAKEAEPPPLQVFATTHSPAVVRELSAAQLHVVRAGASGPLILPALPHAEAVQGTMRSHPEAFLASSAIVCEGASEVGLLRGIDIYLTRNGLAVPIAAKGIALVDAGGVTKIYDRADALRALGYRVSAFRDDDRQPAMGTEAAFLAGGGELAKWRAGRALEDELFASLPDAAVVALVNRAIEIHGEEQVRQHVASALGRALLGPEPAGMLDGPGRQALARAARHSSWFKSVSLMEAVAADIVGPHLAYAEQGFQDILARLFAWMG